MRVVLRLCIRDEAAAGPSFKALAMLENKETCLLLEIELCAMIEGLMPLYQMVYDLEGDGHLVFKVAVWMRRINSMRDARGDRIPYCHSLDPLITSAVQWVQAQPDMQAAVVAAQPTVEDIIRKAGPKPSRSDWPRAELHVGRNREDGRAAAEYASALSSWNAKLEELQIVAAESFRIPHTIEGWHAHTSKGISPAFDYFDDRLEDPDRARALELFVAAELFVPQFARDLADEDAFRMIEQLRLFDKLNNQNTIDGLKKGWCAFKYHACRETRARKELDILQWHYDHRELERSSPQAACPACRAFAHTGCDCEEGLSQYYTSVKLLVLLQPSSAGAERVFSVLKRYFDEQQETSLTDAIRVAIFLEVNNRPLV